MNFENGDGPEFKKGDNALKLGFQVGSLKDQERLHQALVLSILSP